MVFLLFWTFPRYFGHFGDFEGIFVIFEVPWYFWGFQGVLFSGERRGFQVCEIFKPKKGVFLWSTENDFIFYQGFQPPQTPEKNVLHRNKHSLSSKNL